MPKRDDPIKAFLGDVCGDPEPMRLPRYRPKYAPPDWFERLKHTFLAWVAFLIFGLLILAFVAGLFLLAAQPSLAAEPIKTPQACAKLAALFGATAPNTMTRAEVKAAFDQINIRMVLVPQARDCHRALKSELSK